MMRDVFLLRGHEKDVTTLTWHPVHGNFLSSGGNDGVINHYLLDEQNPPEGHSYTLSPYDTPDPKSAPAQVIWPAHSIPHAHDWQVWALAWHPLGHILASGANDKITRFWTRPRPGDSSWIEDQFHLGVAGAKAKGTYKAQSRAQMREEEEREAEEEAEGLVDQKFPSGQQAAMALPGLTAPTGDGTSTGGIQLPGIGGALPPPIPLHSGMPPALPPNMPFDPSKIDMTKIAEMFGGQIPQLPPGMPPGMPPPPFPNFPGGPPPPLPGSMPMPFHPVPPPGDGSMQMPGMPGLGGGSDGVRKRAPLPSQQDSLKEEMRRGNYTRRQ